MIYIDDLLLQMYNNLDNDCLFIIRTSVLEDIWGLPVLDFSRKNIKKSDEKKTISRSAELKKNYNMIFINKERTYSEDAIEYINVDESIPYLQTPASRRYYGGSIDEGMFPKYLPEPQIIYRNYNERLLHKNIYPKKPGDVSFYRPKYTVYKPYSLYYWADNASRRNNILVIATQTTALPSVYFLRNKKVLKTEQIPWNWWAID